MSDMMPAAQGATNNLEEVASDDKSRVHKTQKGQKQKKSALYGRTPVQKIKVNSNEDNLGVRLALIRIMLGQTQESFAELILTNRQSVAAMERCERAEDLSDSSLFRLYYFATEVVNSEFSSKEIKNLSKKILGEVRACISDRTE